MSKTSPYYGNIDWLYSYEFLKAGHTYYVRLNDEARGEPSLSWTSARSVRARP